MGGRVGRAQVPTCPSLMAALPGCAHVLLPRQQVPGFSLGSIGPRPVALEGTPGSWGPGGMEGRTGPAVWEAAWGIQTLNCMPISCPGLMAEYFLFFFPVD